MPEISAHIWIEEQTIRMEEEFHSSRPKPRGKKMGFRREPRERTTRERLWEEYQALLLGR